MKVLPKLVGLIILLILVVLSLVDPGAVSVSTKWIPFLGRFHPVLLHLPIGMFAAVVLLEIYAWFRPVSQVAEKVGFLLAVSFYATVFSALFGIFLSWEGGYEGDAVTFHKWAGVVTAALILGLEWLAKARLSHPDRVPFAYLGGLLATIVAMTLTGHQGGSLTHGASFLTHHNPFAKGVEVAAMTADTPVLVSHVQPILQDYCVQCHSPEKIKGELRLDTFEMLMAGGVNGEAIVPGDSEASSLIHRIHLPLQDEEHMPPEGKPQPSEEIVQLLSWWIDQGASDTARLEDLEVTPEVAIHFLEIDVLEFMPREEIDILIEEMETPETLGIYPLAQEDYRLGVRANKASDEDLLALLPLKANIVELNLSRSAVTDEGLASVGKMTNLTHLHLNNTVVTDVGIERLADLYQLEYLNLYGTDITDTSLEVLRRLKSLKKIFLWETGVTRPAIASLHKSIFPAVESEKLKLQIQELTKKRDNLEVEIVSAFDFETEPVVAEEQVDDSSFSISDIMVTYHKGDTSLASQAREGNADKDDLRAMLEAYELMLNLEPPKGTLESWKLKTNALIKATTDLIEGEAGAVAAYKTAVNCKACHTDHRTD